MTHVKQWHTRTPKIRTQYVFRDKEGNELRDRNGRTVGCSSYMWQVEVRLEPRDRFVSRFSELEEVEVGAVRYVVKTQAERDGKTFGASFPKEYRFSTEAEASKHVQAAVAKAERRQQKRVAEGKI